MTEDSGAITKSSSSTHSNQSAASATSQSHWSPVPVNSHLLVARQAAHRWQSMADLKLTEAEIRSRRTLAHIMNELIQTEEDYVKALKLVVEVYIPEMNREDVPQSLRGKRGVIFGNIEKIYDFHNHYFLKELSNCEQEPFKIYQCFIEHVSVSSFSLFNIILMAAKSGIYSVCVAPSTLRVERPVSSFDKIDLPCSQGVP